MNNFVKIVKPFLILILIISYLPIIGYAIPTKIPGELEFLDKSNKVLKIEDFEDKVVIVHFWGTWCQSCGIEMTRLDKLQKDYRKFPVKVIALSEDFKSIQAIESFYNDNGLKYLDIFYDKKNSIFKELNVTTIPSSFILDKNQYVVHQFNGEVDWDSSEIRFLIDQSLKK